ncbi:MAG: hypothetical protein ACKOOG_00665, partial [Actinomycetota bacterium]
MTGATREGRLAVAIPAAMALGAVGAMAAERMGVSSLLGIGAGSRAALLTVLALPSVPTRRSVVLLLVAGGLGVLRHASGSSPHRSALLVVWAAASLVTLVVLERLGAESMPTVAGARPFATRGREVLRASVLVGVVATVAVAIGVPLASEHLGRSVVAGREPGVGDGRRRANRRASLRRHRCPSQVSKVSPRQKSGRSASTVKTTRSVSRGRVVMSSSSVVRSDAAPRTTSPTPGSPPATTAPPSGSEARGTPIAPARGATTPTST